MCPKSPAAVILLTWNHFKLHHPHFQAVTPQTVPGQAQRMTFQAPVRNCSLKPAWQERNGPWGTCLATQALTLVIHFLGNSGPLSILTSHVIVPTSMPLLMYPPLLLLSSPHYPLPTAGLPPHGLSQPPVRLSALSPWTVPKLTVF